jgi:hypothetical protein
MTLSLANNSNEINKTLKKFVFDGRHMIMNKKNPDMEVIYLANNIS